MTDYVRIAADELDRFTLAVLTKAGMRRDVAVSVTESLVQGELHGLGSHGVSRLLQNYCQRIEHGGMNGDPHPVVLAQSNTTALIDADDSPGAFVGITAMDMAIDMAGQNGCGMVGVRNSAHFGAAFFFAQRAVAKGMIGFATTAAVPMVLPTGGIAPALGTNPLCIGVPGGETSGIMLDMATSVVARGKVQLAALEGHDIPLGWAVTKDGQPTTDAQAGSNGYLLPLGGYKGYGLGLIAEVFSSVLTGAMMTSDIGGLFSNLAKPQSLGHFVGALDVSRFMPIDAFRERIDEVIRRIKATPLEPDVEEILIPGEPEQRRAAENRQKGIPLSEDVMNIMNKLSAQYGVAQLKTL